jgi:hypothetical protein
MAYKMGETYLPYLQVTLASVSSRSTCGVKFMIFGVQQVCLLVANSCHICHIHICNVLYVTSCGKYCFC